MKRMKKLFAILMTMAMVMGLGITGFAETKTSATITVNNASSAATFRYVQVIEPDRETETGWDFVGSAGAQFISAFTDDDQIPSEQDVIKMLIKHEKGEEDYTSEIALALSNCVNNLTLGVMENPQTVTSAGLYVITGLETGYTYGNMAAYVGFGEVKGDGDIINNEYPSLMDVEIDAKKSPDNTDKTTTESDHFVQIGDIVTYNVTAYVPYFNADDTDKTFAVYDDISGAEYYLSGEGSEKKIIMGENPGTSVEAEWDISGEKKHDLYIDLSSLINDGNTNAGKKITVTYTAKITEVRADNTAGSNVGGSYKDSTPVNIYTGNITLKKVGEDSTTTLAGAQFYLTLKDSNEKLTFTKVDTDDGSNVYQYDPEGKVTTLESDARGLLKVQGLDEGTYHFTETKAPEGYYINEAGKDVTITLDKDVATEEISVNDSIMNSKLSALPSTGGMGTTIFTIAGCVIMISAAGLFFASRRKAN